MSSGPDEPIDYARAGLVADTLVGALRAARGSERWGLTFVDTDRSETRFSWGEVSAAAVQRASAFRALGLDIGERVALFVVSERDFTFSFFGAVLAGLVPVPMNPPLALGRPETQTQRAAAILSAGDVRCAVGPRSMAAIMTRLRAEVPGLATVIHEEDLATPVSPAGDELLDRVPDPEATCFLQFTSGSTAAPKGVMVSHRNLAANVAATQLRLGTRPGDVGVCWVPLYHDMGLIGSLITSLLLLGAHVFIPPMVFAARPQIWLEKVHQHRATMTSTNGFGLRAAAKRPPADEGLALSSLRAIVLGAEPIHVPTVQRFVDTFAAKGLDPRAVCCAYGLAEATLAVSVASAGEPLRVLALDRARYESAGQVVPADSAGAGETIQLADCGEVLPGHEVRVLDGRGEPADEGRVGELVVRGPSVARGYYAQPDASASSFRDGWLHTGDLGFVLDRRLYIAGRIKDLIIIGGRNYYPQDIEWVATRVPGVRSDHVIAFAVSSPEEIERFVLLVECMNPHKVDDLEQLIRTAVVSEMGIAPHAVLIVHPWTLPRTSSGKPQRSQAKADFIAGRLRVVENVTPR